MSRDLQAYMEGFRFPAADDRSWIDGPWVGLAAVRAAIAPVGPVLRREAAESAIAAALITPTEAIEAGQALNSIWPDFTHFRGAVR